MLPAYIPDLEIHVWEGNSSDILADGGDGVLCGGGGRGGGGEGVEGFDGVEEGGFAGVVEAEEEDGVFCWWEEGLVRSSLIGGGVDRVRREGEGPSLAVAQK